MDRKEFLTKLSAALSRLPEDDRTEAVNYYDEIISDKIEAGQSEADAVASLGEISILRAYITAESVENSVENSGKSNQKAENADNGEGAREGGKSGSHAKPENGQEPKKSVRAAALQGVKGVKDAAMQKVRRAKTPIKNFFLVLAVCTSPVLLVLGITFLIVLISLLISFAAVGISLVAGAGGAIVYGAAITIHNFGALGFAGGLMTMFASLFVAALLVILSILFIMLAKVIIKWVVLMFARIVKRNRAKQIPGKEGV